MESKMTLKTNSGWFELGRMVGRYVWPLRPKPNEIRNAAQILGITMRDARRAVDYYTWGVLESLPLYAIL
jgi:hypothetical protein